MDDEHSRTNEKRRRIFEAAIVLFQERGYDSVSADDIAERAGCSRATVFNQFGSKAGVLRFFGQELEARASKVLATRPQGSAPLEALQTLLFSMATEVERHRDCLKIVLVHSVQNSDYIEKPTPSREKVLRHMADLIAEAQRRGEARKDIPARELADQINGLYNEATLNIIFRNASAGTALRRLWNFALGGLTVSSSPGHRGKGEK